ncbi:MAG: hypothetical protein ISP92_05455 [Pseudomonadales bacterium]|nr:hypothetical protein [Pseudomonadales bacterium]
MSLKNTALNEVWVACHIIVAFLVLYAFSVDGVRALEFDLLGLSEQLSIFIFLPHGIRILAVWFLRHRALVPLFIAHMCLYQLFSNMPPFWAQVPLALIGAFSPWLSFKLLLWTNIPAYYQTDNGRPQANPLGVPILAGIIAAIFNGLGSFGVLMTQDLKYADFEFLLGYIVGDILGVLIVFICIMSFREVVNYRSAGR